MDSLSFGIWVSVIGIIAGIGLGSMISAYRGKGSVAVIFPEPIADPPPPTASETAEVELAAVPLFQAGCAAFQSGHYRRAIEQFTQALQQEPDWAAAYHNRGRATANLRRVPEGIADLVKAGDLYLQQGETTGLAQIKQDLDRLKTNQVKMNQAGSS